MHPDHRREGGRGPPPATCERHPTAAARKPARSPLRENQRRGTRRHATGGARDPRATGRPHIRQHTGRAQTRNPAEGWRRTHLLRHARCNRTETCMFARAPYLPSALPFDFLRRQYSADGQPASSMRPSGPRCLRCECQCHRRVHGAFDGVCGTLCVWMLQRHARELGVHA